MMKSGDESFASLGSPVQSEWCLSSSEEPHFGAQKYLSTLRRLAMLQ
jgi:hypothetical protein